MQSSKTFQQLGRTREWLKSLNLESYMASIIETEYKLREKELTRQLIMPDI